VDQLPPEPEHPVIDWPRPRRIVRTASGAIAITVAVLGLAALTDASGTALLLLCAAACAALAVVAVRARSATAGVLAAVLAATAVAGAIGLALGGRAGNGGAGYAFPLVVGLPLSEAKAAFQRHGPVTFVVHRAPYGARNVVLRAGGYAPDGTFSPGATVTLLVGGGRAGSASS
jgi:hypothetical protein